MMKRNVQKVLSLVLALVLMFALSTGAFAESTASTADFEVLVPLMDLVCAASQYSPNAPESVPGADGTLSASFVEAFFKVGQLFGEEVGVTADMADDINAQKELLGKIFAAQLPEFSPVVVTDDVNGFIGFHPVSVKNGADGSSIQIIGEIYLADKPMRKMSEADYPNMDLIDRAVFTFQNDASAMNGFRLTGFSVGTDLALEEIMQVYDEEICVEYESQLGFRLSYPAIFTDDILVEDSDGVSAALPDGSASFFAKRVENANGDSLTDYVSIIANGITGSISSVDEELQCGTVTYTTDEGYTVFDVYILTDKYIYQAELRYLTALTSDYIIFNSYLKNSFSVLELSQG